MQVISEGFNLNYEVLQIGSIKPGESGTFQGTPYAASVKFRSTLAFQTENKNVGVQEHEQTIEFKIPCSSESEAIMVSEHLRKARVNGDKVTVKAPLAQKREGADIYKVTSMINGADFIKSLTTAKK